MPKKVSSSVIWGVISNPLPAWNTGAVQFPSNAPQDGEDGAAEAEGDEVHGGDRRRVNRLTSADLWNKGAVTADEAYELVKAKQDARDDEMAAKAARKDARDVATATRLAAAVRGAHAVIIKLQQQGKALPSMSAAELEKACSATELEHLLLSADHTAKKGKKIDMAVRIVEMTTRIVAAQTAAAPTVNQGAVSPDADGAVAQRATAWPCCL